MSKLHALGHQAFVPAASSLRLAFSSAVLSLFACSSPPSAGGPPATGGSSGSATNGGAASTAGTGGSASTSGSASVAGGGNDAGGGGSGTTAGTGGSAGATPSGGSAGMAASGITCTPTGDGNGVHDQPEPYGKPPEANAMPNVPTGTLTPLTPFQSKIYDNHIFGYRIYVPAQYKPGQRAAFMLVEDGPSHYLGGQATEAKFFTNVVMDNLIAEGSVPVTIGLFVDVCMQKCDDERVVIYDDASDKYARFVTEELLPAVISGKYDVVQDPEAWLAVGFSAGAAQSFTVMWNRPIFHKFIGHNTSFPAAKDHGVDYAALVPNTENKGFRVTLTSGTNDLSDARGNWLEYSKQMEMVLAAKGYPVRLMTGTGGHYPPDQSSMGFPNDLRWMWQGCRLADY
ncbi:MAG TPA: alpha/beta hydrolase-fold protein [Polyangiaceae bacterium]|nr:alpha/beta hydrolase-fold protein [Polyangiaceae bacterium]